MQKLIETLQAFGIVVPEDKQSDVKKALSEHYKHIGEFTKTLGKIEAERDSWKIRAEAAEKSLEGFEGADPTQLKKQLEEAQQRIREVQKESEAKLAERDFTDALRTELDKYQFSSAAARKAIEADIRAAGLKMTDGQIYGLSDFMDKLKQQDASAFVDEAQSKMQAQQARFTQPKSATGGTALTKQEILSIKDPIERQSKMIENPHLFPQLLKITKGQ